MSCEQAWCTSSSLNNLGLVHPVGILRSCVECVLPVHGLERRSQHERWSKHDTLLPLPGGLRALLPFTVLAGVTLPPHACARSRHFGTFPPLQVPSCSLVTVTFPPHHQKGVLRQPTRGVGSGPYSLVCLCMVFGHITHGSKGRVRVRKWRNVGRFAQLSCAPMHWAPDWCAASGVPIESGAAVER